MNLCNLDNYLICPCGPDEFLSISKFGVYNLEENKLLKNISSKHL